MTLTTVTGRVRATSRLKTEGDGGARVVVTSWSSARAFPRTLGLAVPFDLEAADGTLTRVDPFEAVVVLPVRAQAVREGVRHEEAWIAAEDEITVEGELERAGRARQPPTLRARRIVGAGGARVHRLPPRTLQRGESEKLEAAPVTPVVTMAVGGEPVVAAPGAEEAVARRPKKKRAEAAMRPAPAMGALDPHPATASPTSPAPAGEVQTEAPPSSPAAAPPAGEVQTDLRLSHDSGRGRRAEGSAGEGLDPPEPKGSGERSD
jgi:hypothetical protein